MGQGTRPHQTITKPTIAEGRNRATAPRLKQTDLMSGLPRRYERGGHEPPPNARGLRRFALAGGISGSPTLRKSLYRVLPCADCTAARRLEIALSGRSAAILWVFALQSAMRFSCGRLTRRAAMQCGILGQVSPTSCRCPLTPFRSVLSRSNVATAPSRLAAASASATASKPTSVPPWSATR